MILLTSVYIPDGDEARRWAEDELSRTIYAEAMPTPFDRFAKAIADFLAGLFTARPGDAFAIGPIALVVGIVVAALVVALLVWGVPRRSRTIRRTSRDLLGARDDRTATQLRADAARSARAGSWAEATILRYRAIARDLLERDLIDPSPGATAQAIAREAAVSFPHEAPSLGLAASLFDDVRYLGGAGSGENYQIVAELDERLHAQTPALVPA